VVTSGGVGSRSGSFSRIVVAAWRTDASVPARVSKTLLVVRVPSPPSARVNATKPGIARRSGTKVSVPSLMIRSTLLGSTRYVRKTAYIGDSFSSRRRDHAIRRPRGMRHAIDDPASHDNTGQAGTAQMV